MREHSNLDGSECAKSGERVLKLGGVEASEGQAWWVAWPDLEWSALERSQLDGQGHEACEGPKLERSGQRERLKLEGK